MRRRVSPVVSIIVVSLLCAAPASLARAAGDAGGSGELLRHLRPGHPRLMLVAEDFARVKAAIAARDPVMTKWHDALRAEAEKMLKAKPVEHVLIGPRLLDKSRTALGRITLLAALYRLDGDSRFADRAKLEMQTVCAFADWNPSHFLDVAEMTCAVALGYDWLYDVLTPEERATFKRGIVELGLKQSLPTYEKQKWWSVVHHNWNQVCNGGMTVGALAIADEEPALAGTILNYARNSIPKAMASFGPDGGWEEGPGYWAYATQYNVYFLAACESALGTDFGLKKSPGFPETGFFRIHSIGPTGRTFDYADAHEGAGMTPQMFWLARAFKQPAFVGAEMQRIGSRPDVLHLFWYDGAGRTPTQAELPLDALFKGVDVAFFRSAWDDPQAFYIGFKGGDNKANHSHLDLGSFVMDAYGERWALDLGADEYNMTGYFGKQRWTYYRLRTEGHNTLTINGTENQDPTAKAPLLAFRTTPDRAFAITDLSAAYKGQGVARARRGIALLKRRQVVVQDEVDAGQPVGVTWNFHTPAKVTINSEGNTALLSGHKAAMVARIQSPTGAKFVLVSANPPKKDEREHQQPDVSNLTVALPAKTTQSRIVVLLQGRDDTTAAPPVVSLDSWTAEGKMK